MERGITGRNAYITRPMKPTVLIPPAVALILVGSLDRPAAPVDGRFGNRVRAFANQHRRREITFNHETRPAGKTPQDHRVDQARHPFPEQPDDVGQ